MARIVVIGGGVAGLASALALSRQGHEVTVVERDATPLPESADEAFEWDRRGAPQVRHSHALLARLRNLLRDHYPDLLDDLHEAGATDLQFLQMGDPALRPEPAPGDEDLVALACRRTTFEWVLRRDVTSSDHVSFLDGATVTALRHEVDAATGLLVVTGVELSSGAGGGTDPITRTLDADVVVAAGGRRDNVPSLLAPLGIHLQAEEEDTGIVYFSRFYRLAPGADYPPHLGPIAGDLGYLKFGVFEGDNRTFSITLASLTSDKQMRSALLHPEGFERAALALFPTVPYREPGLAEPITKVHVMAKLINRRRRYTDDQGQPLVLGFHAVGDAHTCTNPLYGRGCSLGFVQAQLLSEAAAAHPDDAVARAVAYEAASAREVEPWYLAAVAQDQAGRRASAALAAQNAAAVAGSLAQGGAEGGAGADAAVGLDAEPEVGATDAEVADSGPPADGSEPAGPAGFDMEDVVAEGLMPAVRDDPAVLRAFLRMFNLLQPPDSLMADSYVIGKIFEAYQGRHERPPQEPFGPERPEMLALLAQPSDT